MASGPDPVVEDSAFESAKSSLLKDGYFVLPGVIDPRDAARAARLVEAVTAAGWPPPFALVYDHIWQVLGRLTPLFARFFGHPPSILPDYWVWLLDGKYESAGWGWHRDDKFQMQCFDERGHPLVLTVWLPFTDATVANGCMYVLPRSVDTKDETELKTMKVPQRLQASVRGLPAPAGSVLAWDMYVLHRGGRFTAAATNPRISLGIYFQSPAIGSLDGHPICRGDRLPLMERLGIVSRMIGRYEKVYRFEPELLCSCRKWATLYSLARDLPGARGTP
jgi:hypothetical protein